MSRSTATTSLGRIAILPSKRQRRFVVKNFKHAIFLIRFVIRKAILPRSTVTSFFLAYIYIVLPKIIARTINLLRLRDIREAGATIRRILIKAFDVKGFPVFIGKLIATLNILSPAAKIALTKAGLPSSSVDLTATLIASFLAALLNFPSFQKQAVSFDRYYTLDLTLTLVTRALDSLFSVYAPFLLSYYNLKEEVVYPYGDALLFIVSCYFIMVAWFYEPEKLSPGYRKWITSASNTDLDMVKGMKYIQEGKLQYIDPKNPPKELPSEQHHFEEFCKKYNKDPSLGDLTIRKKLPCVVIHSFDTKSCAGHALNMFYKEFKFAFKLYGTLNVIMFIFRRRAATKRIVSSFRSAMFLGTFTALNWYFLCLFRNEPLTSLFPGVSQATWDSISPKIGALASGFSCFLETPSRRKELSLFVAPKAMGTFVSPEPTKTNLQLETIAFSVSFATLVSFAKSDSSKVRGLVGKALGAIFKN
ncbi:uncharacterized protein RJT20DRAFT_37275 [Scheffersomyces xylosifermentans]|uniref:uncharacterized protein n=1 Tax=Scheffersomyces xylosifermentans TaxID=1304137 RepID=UPI00315DCA27